MELNVFVWVNVWIKFVQNTKDQQNFDLRLKFSNFM